MLCIPSGPQPPLSTGTAVLTALPLPALQLWVVGCLADRLCHRSSRPRQGVATPLLGVPLHPRRDLTGGRSREILCVLPFLTGWWHFLLVLPLSRPPVQLPWVPQV